MSKAVTGTSQPSDSSTAPISYGQERMWFTECLAPGNPANHIRGAVQLIGQLNIYLLQQSLSELIKRHEILRTSFTTQSDSGQPRQVINPSFTVELPVIDLQNLPPTEREEEAWRQATEIVQQPFSLSQAPLWRVGLIKLEETKHILVLSMHHIVCDGDWSLGIFFGELAALHKAFAAGEPSPLPPLSIQYKDFTLWQREQLTSEVLETQLVYWKQQLGYDLPVLQLPTDRPRPTVQTYAGASQEVALSNELSQKLKRLSQQEGAPLFVTLLAVFKTLLYRYTSQDRILVGSPTSGRHHPHADGLIGYFGNPVVLCTNMSGNPTFRELLFRVRNMASQAEENQHYPFQRLVEALQPKRDPSYTSFFQVLFTVRDAPERSWTQALMPIQEIGEVTLAPMDVENKAVAYDLIVSIKDSEQGLRWMWEYNTDLFDHASVTRMLGHCQTLLKSVVADPDQPIGYLAYLTEAERHQIMVEWNPTTQTAYPQVCIHQLIEEQVELTPDVAAVIFYSEQLTYRELNCRANQLAHYLPELGVKPGDLVGLCIERSIEMLVAIVAVMKAGGAYVPLDSDYPKERLGYMLSDARVKVVLTTEKLLRASPKIAEITQALQTVCLDKHWDPISQQSKENPRNDIQPHNLVYCLYTSGSTGQPKGVAVEHRALSNMIAWHLDVWLTDVGTRTLLFSPISFDVSFHELAAAWCSGGTLVQITEDVRRDAIALLEFIIKYKVEKIFFPFVALQQLAEAALPGAVPTTLREIIVGGEPLQITPEIAKLMKQTSCVLHNHYGSTECLDITAYTLTGEVSSWPTLPPIGRPTVYNTRVYVLDQFQQLVPVGVAGELYADSDCLARGYLHRPELTAERFIPNPFTPDFSGRLYKTHDLGRYLPDGNIEFLGRTDHQVKVRGFRIELGEVEAVLAKHPAVRECAVVPREDGSGHKRLVAYVVPAAAQADNTLSAFLRAYLKEELPDYMVPAAIAILDPMPLTPSGKVDRRALPAPDATAQRLNKEVVLPRTPMEERIGRIWAEALGLAQADINTTFFEQGGHSLLAVKVLAVLRETFQMDLSLSIFSERDTIAALADYIDALKRVQDSALIDSQIEYVEGEL